MINRSNLILSTSPQTQPSGKPYKTASLNRRQRLIYGRKRCRYTGKEQDVETGLYYFGARYLDSKTGRWLSGDPALGDYVPQSGRENKKLPNGGVYNTVNFHVYHYSNNNPVKYADPDGEVPVIPLLIIVASTLAITSDRQSKQTTNGQGALVTPNDRHPEGRTLNGNNQSYLQTQQNLVGSNYVWNGNDPDVDGGVDCSGGVLYGLNSLGNNLPDQRANDIYNNYTYSARGEPQGGNVRFLSDDQVTQSHIQTIVSPDGTRINATGGPANTRENPGTIETLPGPLPSSGEVRAFRWNQDYQN